MRQHWGATYFIATIKSSYFAHPLNFNTDIEVVFEVEATPLSFSADLQPSAFAKRRRKFLKERII